MLQEQVSPSEGECLASGGACSVGELLVSNIPDEDCSHHTGSHSVGEMWNCHCFEVQVSIKKAASSSTAAGKHSTVMSIRRQDVSQKGTGRLYLRF
jgi:hypothetical protein